MKGLIKKSVVLIILFCVCMPVYANTEKEDVPEQVQTYAENKGFETFVEVSPALNLDLQNPKELCLGEGFPVYLIKNNESSEAFEDLLDTPHKWTYFIETTDGEMVGHLEIVRSENQLTSFGGGQAPYVRESVKKMRELIQ